MAKRLTDTDKWKDDWYLKLSNDYKIIWQWLLDNCSHAGFCKRSLELLIMMCKTNISEEDLISAMKGRVLCHKDYWFIPNFVKFQYSTLYSLKPAVVSVVKEIFLREASSLIPESFGNNYVIIEKSFENHLRTIKDKVKDKDTDKNINSEGEYSDRLNSNLSHSGLNFSLEKSAEKNLSFPLSETQPKVEFENSEDYVSKLFDSGTIQLAPKEFPTWRQECKEFLLDKYQQAALRKETGLRDAELMQHKRDFLVRLNIECDFKNAAALKKHFANYLRKHFGASFLPGKSSAFIQPEFTDYSQMEIRE